MIKILLTVAGAVVLTGLVLAMAIRLSTPTALPAVDAQTFARANQLYATGQYDAAVSLYSQLIDEGVENPDVYYNLGRTYEALGNQVKAGEQYQRAQALAPRDPDIGQVAVPTGGFLPPVSQNEIAIAALGAMCMVAAGFVVVRRREPLLDH
jgi:tetratricopeptide (TPR) repeat protein